MTLEALLAKLAERQALIVHFSHHAAMRGKLVYPMDLHQVFADDQTWPLSCSVLTPGHKMSPVGSVGVVLEPRVTDDVVRVHYDDAGAWSDDDGLNFSLGAPLSEGSFDDSLDRVVPGSYNEWRVRNAKPLGIFVLDPNFIEVRQEVSFEGPDGWESTIAPCRINLASVRTTFPGWPIWTITSDGPVQV